jgi:hypothetical protein
VTGKEPGAEERHYEGADTVRAMLRLPDLDVEKIDEAARKHGWPTLDPHPYLIAEYVSKKLGE